MKFKTLTVSEFKKLKTFFENAGIKCQIDITDSSFKRILLEHNNEAFEITKPTYDSIHIFQKEKIIKKKYVLSFKINDALIETAYDSMNEAEEKQRVLENEHHTIESSINEVEEIEQ